MNLSDAKGLELERREKVMDDCEKAYRAWAKSLPPTSINRTYGDVWKAAWDYQQARIEALEGVLREMMELDKAIEETTDITKEIELEGLQTSIYKTAAALLREVE